MVIAAWMIFVIAVLAYPDRNRQTAAACPCSTVSKLSRPRSMATAARTTRTFTKGDTVCFGDGVLYREDDDFDDTYALILPGEDSGLGANFFWDLVDQTRWFNHSCDPNSEVLSKWDHEAQHVSRVVGRAARHPGRRRDHVRLRLCRRRRRGLCVRCREVPRADRRSERDRTTGSGAASVSATRELTSGVTLRRERSDQRDLPW